MAWAAGGTCAGGLVGGPPGALVGGFIGMILYSCIHVTQLTYNVLVFM